MIGTPLHNAQKLFLLYGKSGRLSISGAGGAGKIQAVSCIPEAPVAK
ncbi:hypothetical protein HMPREF1546_02043 [Oscillibacter sp. KLE 1745]|nr:hypothetical protein HMPREF1546_02043 [Oscillibacter sp. KLE 1745]